MRTASEKVADLHQRMETRKRVREKRKTSALSAACAGLALCLMLLIFGGGKAHLGGTAGLYTGATMLFDGAGIYVLVALLAFMTGVAVTIFCIHRQKHKPRPPEEQDEPQEKQEATEEPQ